jgi:predicted RNA-binding Zn-ribbon protein involved in translation (DUF1610 family)
MASCNHTALELLSERKSTRRCLHCHLTIAAEELGEGFCPECFDTSGIERYEFEEVASEKSGARRYRCEECGAIITAA